MRLTQGKAKICIIEDDIWVFSSKFKCDSLNSTVHENFLSDFSRPSECNFVYTPVSYYSIPCTLSKAWKYINNTFGDPSLLNQFSQSKCT